MKAESSNLDEPRVVRPQPRGAAFEGSERDLQIEHTRADDLQIGRDLQEAIAETRPGQPDLRTGLDQGRHERGGLSRRGGTALRRRVRSNGPKLGEARRGNTPAVIARGRTLDRLARACSGVRERCA